MFSREFFFAEGGEGIRLSAGDYYDESKGYGFLGLAAQERAADRFTGTGGWNPRETYCPGEGEEAGLWQDGADGVEVKAGFLCGSGRRCRGTEAMR